MKNSQFEEIVTLLSNMSRQLEVLRVMQEQELRKVKEVAFGPTKEYEAMRKMTGRIRRMNDAVTPHQDDEELEDLRAQSRADNRREAFNVLRRVERLARYKGGLAEAIDYLNDDDAELLAEFCATVLRITARSERVLPDGVTINP